MKLYESKTEKQIAVFYAKNMTEAKRIAKKGAPKGAKIELNEIPYSTTYVYNPRGK